MSNKLETPEFAKVAYEELNAKQKEVHNFHQIAARLATYGYATYPIRDDWNGGDMIARHMTDTSSQVLTIQIKSRATFGRKYRGKSLWIGFPLGSRVYVYPHDDVLRQYEELRKSKGRPLDNSGAWSEGGLVHWKKPPEDLLQILAPYVLEP
jgi:hypothetical protein